MFILIPLALIFLCEAYLRLNDNLSVYTEVFVYFLMVLIATSSAILYKNIKKNMRLQDINVIKLEVIELQKKLKTTDDEVLQSSVTKKIENLQKEIESLSL
ncbi:MAG: hypothetical protein U9Q33_11760 [Campylobacterota bacterium]|nr:hypothetical protein [Campylobacterota bacterium]